jgi:putative FmdB family regulatory protein
MPIYEYACEACGHAMEKLQKISDEPLKDCPQCQQPRLRKLISAVAFRLKGSGWYETDFKSGNKKNVVNAEGKESKSESDGAAAKPKSDSDSGASAKSEPASKPASGSSGSSENSAA